MVGSTRVLISLAAVAAMLTACSGGKASPTSQLVAPVDVREISDEQLLAKLAFDSELDRDPAVVQALELALDQTRRQVLARAYVDRLALTREPIGAAEQIEYYKQHPALFEKRKVFQMMVYTIETDALPAAVRAELGTAHTVDDVSRMLAAHGLIYETQSLNRGAEQLPLDDLAKFDAAKVGDVMILPPQQGRVAVMQILGIQASPIGIDRAQPIIQQYLANTRNAKALEEHLRQARAAAGSAYLDNVNVAATGRLAGQLK